MQDTSCAFYKIQQILVKNPGALSQEEVSYVCQPFWIVTNLQLSRERVRGEVKGHILVSQELLFDSTF